jgi:1-deoxyxylulose-5-phosphate synthase
MEYRTVGRSGLVVSAIGLGGTPFGSTIDGDAAVSLIRAALDLGVTLVDTAVTYSGGRSEELIGRAIQGRRDEVVLATKVGLRAGDGPYRTGLSRRRICQAIETSLRRLRTDHVDLYQAHKPDPDTPVEETLDAFDRLVRDGKVRYLGGSNYAAWQMAEVAGIAERRGLQPWTSAQNRFNLLDGLDDPSLLPAARRLGFGLLPYMPLASGVLSGKYRPGEPPPPGTKAADLPRIRAELTADRLQAAGRVSAWAAAHGRTAAEVAIGWLLTHPEVSSVIAGVRSVEQLHQNLRALDAPIEPAERDALRTLTVGAEP